MTSYPSLKYISNPFSSLQVWCCSLFWFRSLRSVTHPCPALCNPMDYSPPGSSVHGLFQARIPEWVTISSSRGPSGTRDQVHDSCISCTGSWLLHKQHLKPYVSPYCLITEMLSWGLPLPVLWPSDLCRWLWAEWSLRHSGSMMSFPGTPSTDACPAGSIYGLLSVVISNYGKRRRRRRNWEEAEEGGIRVVSGELWLGALHWLYTLHNNLQKRELLTP